MKAIEQYFHVVLFAVEGGSNFHILFLMNSSVWPFNWGGIQRPDPNLESNFNRRMSCGNKCHRKSQLGFKMEAHPSMGSCRFCRDIQSIF